MFYVYSVQKNSTNPSHPRAQDKTDKTQNSPDGERAHSSEKSQGKSQPGEVIYGPKLPKGGLPPIENSTLKDFKNKPEFQSEGPNLPTDMLKNSTNVEKAAPSASEDKLKEVGKDRKIDETLKEENAGKKKIGDKIDGNKLEISKTGKTEKHQKRAESGEKSEKSSSSRKSRRSKSPKKSPVQVGSSLDRNPGKRYLTQLAVKEILAITKRSVSQTDVTMTSSCDHDVTKRSASQNDVTTSEKVPEEEISEENMSLETGVLNSDIENALDSALNQDINQSNDSADERKTQATKTTSKKSQQALASIVGIILKRDVSGKPSYSQAKTDSDKIASKIPEVTSQGQTATKVTEKGQGQTENSSQEMETKTQGQIEGQGHENESQCHNKVNKESKGHEKVIAKGQNAGKVGQKVIW